jgi:hypothetical protein
MNMYIAKVVNNISIHWIALCATGKPQITGGLDEHMFFFDEEFQSSPAPILTKWFNQIIIYLLSADYKNKQTAFSFQSR